MNEKSKNPYLIHIKTKTPDNVVIIRFNKMINNFRPPSPIKQLTTIAMAITTANTETTDTFRNNAPSKPINSNVKHINAIINIATALISKSIQSINQ